MFSYYSYFLFFFSKKKNKKTKTNSPLILFVFFHQKKNNVTFPFRRVRLIFRFLFLGRRAVEINERRNWMGKKKRRNRQAVKGSREIRLARRYAAKWRWRNNKKKQPKHEIRKIINAKRNDNKTRNDFPPSAMGPRRAVSAAVGADEMILPSFFVLFFFFFFNGHFAFARFGSIDWSVSLEMLEFFYFVSPFCLVTSMFLWNDCLINLICFDLWVHSFLIGSGYKSNGSITGFSMRTMHS